MIATKDIGWIAGFMEGEGSFISGNRGNIACCAAQKQREPLERLQRLLGGNIYGPYKSCHNMYSWRINGSIAIGVMFTIYDLMSPRRKEQIRKCITYWKSRPVAAWYKAEIQGWPRGCLGHSPQGDIIRRELGMTIRKGGGIKPITHPNKSHPHSPRP